MTLPELTSIIDQKSARLAVIGLGYVGLPVACRFAQAGFDVLGIDIRPKLIEKINNRVLPIEGIEPGLEDLLKSVVQHNASEGGILRGSTQYEDLTECNVLLICVETPVDEHHIPQYNALKSALNDVEAVMKSGALVIVESTIAPGTIEKVVLPILEARGKRLNRDFYLGHCPERVMPGKLLANLTNVSRVVGGMTPETAATMVALYKHIVQADLDPTDCITAELVKTTENAYRDVQIAFANEIALICEAVGGDVWKVRELVNKSPQRNMHLPGAGVGGHCIPKDPWLLAYSVQGMDFPLRLIPAARVINEAMPKHMVKLLSDALQEHNLEIANSRILILGYSYNADSDDIRNSPSEIVEKMLLAEGAEVVIHDPYVSKFQGDLIEKAVNCNAAVLMVTHSSYRQINLAQLNEVLKIPILVDGRNWIDSQLAKRVGLKYYGLGLAQSKSG